jgi:hypothetical protein
VLRLDLTPPRITSTCVGRSNHWKQVICISKENTLERLLKELQLQGNNGQAQAYSFLDLGHRSAMTQLAFSSRMEES